MKIVCNKNLENQIGCGLDRGDYQGRLVVLGGRNPHFITGVSIKELVYPFWGKQFKVGSRSINSMERLKDLNELLTNTDDVDLNKILAEWGMFFNFARPHGAFKGKTPYEAMRLD